MIGFYGLLGGTFVADALLGDPDGTLHPVALFGRLAGGVETLCRRTLGDGIFSGLIGWLMLTVPTAAGAAGTVWLAQAWRPWAGLLAAVAWCWATVALRSLTDHARRIRRQLGAGNLDGARRALARIVSRDTANLSESEIVRGGIESVGENLVDAVTSAYFWMLVGALAGGLPGAVAGAVWLRAVNTLDACWGYKNARYYTFGRVAARMDDLVHWLPARLSVAAIASAAWLTGGHPAAAVRMAFRHRHDHPSPNSGWGMAAFAGALGLRLGGPTVYDGVAEEYPYWGDGRAELTAADLGRAERLAWAAGGVFLILTAGGYALWQMCCS